MTIEAHAKDASNKSMCSDLSVATYWFYSSLVPFDHFECSIHAKFAL